MITLTQQQRQVVDAFAHLRSGERKQFNVGGHAGTGKSVIIDAIVREYGDDVTVCTPTGKAAHVLRSKGVEHACTVHSLLYRPVLNKGTLDFVGRSIARIPLMIVDEASMLSARLVRDIKKKTSAVMFIGDHGQLGPIGDDPGLMSDLDIRLEHIHRQAAGSPIIQFASHVRAGHLPETCGDLARVQYGGTSDLDSFDVVICGFNRSRVELNAWIRRRRGFTGRLPQVDEQVICLRNDSDRQVWNGMTGVVIEVDAEHMRLSVDTDDGPRTDMSFDPLQFGATSTLPYPTGKRSKVQRTLWDWGYAITCHKSQGSEWGRVAVKEEIAPTWSAERWRYTAATRASQELRWVMPT